jgi:hypothetical protein
MPQLMPAQRGRKIASMIDAECEARCIIERAGFDLGDAPGAWPLVAELLGERAVERVPARILKGADAEICRMRDEYRIFVSNALGPARRAFVVMHELAHWHLGILYHDPEVEDACDAIAAALLCPRAAFSCALERRGEAWGELANDFGVDASCAALRYGEITRRALVLLTPERVRVRGEQDAALDGLDGPALRKARPRGFRRERLPDDRAREVLVAV